MCVSFKIKELLKKSFSLIFYLSYKIFQKLRLL
ncbi:hypothetical protein CJE0393 [Campylobacter jejuni RM1221]|nr:hypothetical protein CJE0393 [Campylobacter jejuni RM1221]